MRSLRVALVEVSRESAHIYSRNYLPRVGIATLAALLTQAGHHCHLWFQAMSSLDEQKLKDYDLVGISSLTNTIDEAYRLADFLKGSGVTVVMGGPHVSFMLEEALEHCDYVVVGEGDLSFPSLVQALAKGEKDRPVPGIACRRGGEIDFNPAVAQVDFESLPSPDFSPSPQVSRERLPPIITTSRGCPHNCSFCTVSAMFGRRYRFKKNEQVLAELKPVLNRSVCFGDDNFFANPPRTKALLREMLASKTLPLRWSGEMCVEAGSDEELLELLSRTRCRIVFVGIESINPDTLRKYRKAHKLPAIANCIASLHRHGVGIHGMFVVSPDDHPRTVREITDYAIANDIDTIQIMSLTPFPGTPSMDEYKDRLLHQEWKYFDGMHVVVSPASCSAYELQMAITQGMKRFYSLKRVAGAFRRGRGWRVKYRLGAGYIVRRWLKENREYLERLRTGFYRPASA